MKEKGSVIHPNVADETLIQGSLRRGLRPPR